MAIDATASVDASTEVMASVDPSTSGSQFIIADISCDNAWLSMQYGDAPSLQDWR
ncbi:MAG: DUF7556 family protein [Halobacteriota archaeon]